MELKWHKIWKPWEEKKSQTVVKDTEPKDKAKGSIKGGEKKLLMSHIWYIYISLGYYDIQLSSYQRIIKMKWNGDNLKYKTYLD